MSKVYCEDCKWFKSGDCQCEDYGCFHWVNYPKKPVYERVNGCCVLNANNDCAFFAHMPRRKWWKIWA